MCILISFIWYIFFQIEVGHNNKSAIATVIDDPKKPLLPLSVSDVVKSRASLVSPCVGLVTESTNNCHSSDDVNIEVDFWKLILGVTKHLLLF